MFAELYFDSASVFSCSVKHVSYEMHLLTYAAAYGLTESSPVTHCNTPPVKIGTIGHVISTTEAKLCIIADILSL